MTTADPRALPGRRTSGPAIVARPTLWEQLQRSARVTVVSAPAGSGKTVLLASWIDQANLADSAAWVQVVRDERDPQRFWLSELSRPAREPLSKSELRVLRYLPTHLSAPEIASELYVSASTVRTHMRNIYAKLGAHSRTEAVASAQSLGLLAPAASAAST